MANTTLSNSSSGNSTIFDIRSAPKVMKIYTISLFVVGSIGNSITIYILSRKHNRTSSTANFLLALAISDLCMLCFGSFNNWLNSMWAIDFRNTTTFGCQLHIFLSYVPVSMSSWLLALVTLERVVSVVWPHKIKDVFTVMRTRLCIGLTFLILSVFFSHFFFGYGSTDDPDLGMSCIETGSNYIRFLNDVFPYFDLLVIFLVPCLIIVIGNVTIIYHLARMRSRRGTMGTVTSHHARRDSSVTRTLIIAGVLFVLTVSPISIFFITFGYKMEGIADPWMNDFVQILLNELASTNAGINFYLYVLRGEKFRGEVKALFRCGRGERGAEVGSVFENGNHGGSIRDEDRKVYAVELPTPSSNVSGN